MIAAQTPSLFVLVGEHRVLDRLRGVFCDVLIFGRGVLGFGHDRGARVGYRLCLGHGARVTRFCSLDVVPTLHMWDTNDRARALGAFHWSFLAQPAPFPETFIGFDPDGFHAHLMKSWAAPMAGIAFW